MSLLDRIIKVEGRLCPEGLPNVHQIPVYGNTTKQQAKSEYMLNHKIEPGDYFVYILVYPDYCGYKHTEFVRKNEALFDNLFNTGFTMDEIFKKYT